MSCLHFKPIPRREIRSFHHTLNLLGITYEHVTDKRESQKSPNVISTNISLPSVEERALTETRFLFDIV